MVTSSAVVGSSAISSFGSFAIDIAIIARCRMPPENSCGYCLIALVRVRHAHEREQVDDPLHRLRRP